MAAPTNAANVKKVLVNSEPSTHGTSRHFGAMRNLVAGAVTGGKPIGHVGLVRQWREEARGGPAIGLAPRGSRLAL
jgi:hypothetical protein